MDLIFYSGAQNAEISSGTLTDRMVSDELRREERPLDGAGRGHRTGDRGGNKMTKKILQQVEEHAVADRLKLAADRIRQSRAVPDVTICDAIGDSAWFREYCTLCLQAPIANSFLGCILFGWQLCEEYKRLEQKVYLA